MTTPKDDLVERLRDQAGIIRETYNDRTTFDRLSIVDTTRLLSMLDAAGEAAALLTADRAALVEAREALTIALVTEWTEASGKVSYQCARCLSEGDSPDLVKHEPTCIIAKLDERLSP